MVIGPTLHTVAAAERGVLVWEITTPMMSLSSAPVGGGFGRPGWIINIGVAKDYMRTDLAAHVGEVTSQIALCGAGIALFTAAAIDQVQQRDVGGVVVDATVGITKPTWAADASGSYTSWSPGTINLVIRLPNGLDAGAAVNAVITATEAKTQALAESNVPGTGTASDAIVVVWPAEGQRERFAGPRSEWGSRIALAVYGAVRAGVERSA
ncbi:Adenosylcobinamide amidohydrolase [hydrothermal vent metagenome]|uniref:Adenosylcobinamide amidohydrolase n=1 Tax=hydrothermal vent metagenome TaxID=652676 RepID=A0A3B0T3H2_9ZZZZ